MSIRREMQAIGRTDLRLAVVAQTRVASWKNAVEGADGITLSYVNDSDGIYRGLIQSDDSPPDSQFEPPVGVGYCTFFPEF